MSPGSRPKKRLCVSLLTAESFSKGCYPAKAGSEKERSGFSLSPDGVEGRILRKLAYGRVFFEGLLSGESRQREGAKRILAEPGRSEGKDHLIQTHALREKKKCNIIKKIPQGGNEYGFGRTA